VENERKRITNAVIATATIIPNRHAWRNRLIKWHRFFKRTILGEDAKKRSKDQAPTKRDNSHAPISINSSHDAWILDSCATHHINKKCFIFYFCMHGSSHPHGRWYTSWGHWLRESRTLT
jgi:hypothetical protein